MLFTEEKLKSRVRELESYRYLNRKTISDLKVIEDESKIRNKPPKVDNNWEEFQPRDYLHGRDKYFWLNGKAKVAESVDGNPAILLFDFSKYTNENPAGFEGQCYINGSLYQAVDSNHKEVILDDEYNGQTIDVSIMLWTGLEGGGEHQDIYHRLNYADQAVLSKITDDLYYNAVVFLETLELLDENNENRYKLLEILDNTFKLIDWSRPGDEAFYQSIEEADKYINGEIDQFEKNSDVNVTAIGHTHIDVPWLWQLKHTREKSVRSFSTVLRLMKQYPEYIFLQTQPQLYEFVKEDDPELYEQIKEKIEEGQWEVDGAMWLESDANMPSGESLVRQILFGKKFIKDEFNQDINYLWLPDVFGYSWALPQILKKSGINTFMTTKISWNQYNRMPHDTFMWKGIDGSEILTHFITTPEPNAEEDSFFYTYNGQITPSTVKGIYEGYRNKDFNSNLLLAYGYGDGGGGVNREMLEKRRRIDKMPELPNIKPGTAKEYFDELNETVDTTDKYIHTWDGELYLEYHRGTYTSQARNKNWNRRLELLYRDVEILSSWMMLQGVDYPQNGINEGWKIILRNQSHDTLPGSSITEVYGDSEIEYSEANNIASDILEDIRNVWEKEENHWTVVNTAGWERDEIVFIPTDNKNGVFKDENGEQLKAIKKENGYEVYIEKILPLGIKEILFTEQNEELMSEESLFYSEENGIDTPYYKIRWNQKGHLVKIYDIEAKRNILQENGRGNVLQLFEDKPMNWDAWDIDIFYQDKMKELEANSIKVEDINDLYAKIKFDYSFGDSTISQYMIVYSTDKRIDFKTKVSWKERQKLLKTAFEVDIRATEATYDIQYGNVKRPTHWNTSWDMARFESVGHQWADLSENSYGISLLNNNKYGYDIKDNVMRLSLLKGAIHPDPEADIGKHEFIYSIYPHIGGLVESDTVKEAWSINSPIIVTEGKTMLASQLIDIESDYPVMIDAVKKSENEEALIVRVHDHTGGRRQIGLTPSFDYSEWGEANLMEEIDSNSMQTADTAIEITLDPFEVKTLIIK